MSGSGKKWKLLYYCKKISKKGEFADLRTTIFS